MSRFACYDPVLPPYVVRLTIHGSMIRLNLEQARELQDQLRSAVIDATLEEIPPTDPAPPDPEPVTRPAVKVCPACKRPRRQRGSCSDEFHSLASSQNLRAVTEELRSLMPKDEDPKT